MRTLRLYGDPVLREKAKPVTDFDDAIRQLTRDMLVIMYREEGVGLAAPQVGESLRLIVVDPDPKESEHRPLTLVNPTIQDKQGQTVDEEGCLSFPDVYCDVARAERIRVQFFDLDGNERTLDADGWLARVIQHEIDHLDGVLFVDHMSRMQRQLAQNALRKIRVRATSAPSGRQ